MSQYHLCRLCLPILIAAIFAGQLSAADQEFYELRIYEIKDSDNHKLVDSYLKDGLVPALQRLKIQNVGVFTNAKDKEDFNIYMLIPFKSMESFASLNKMLAKDKEYQDSSKDYFARKLREPAFERINSRFLKAFAGMPVIEMPEYSKAKTERIFELRLYQSHTEDHAARKVAMFNDGEIDVMRDVKMAPIFFGETLIGEDVPNLVYMLSAKNAKAHQDHWKGFLKHPKWNEMKKDPKYKDTVSKIQNWFLIPTSYSAI